MYYHALYKTLDLLMLSAVMVSQYNSYNKGIINNKYMNSYSFLFKYVVIGDSSTLSTT